MKLFKQFAILATLALTGSGAASASNISSVSYDGMVNGNNFFGFQATDWVQTFNFQGFNPTLGTLTGVQFHLNGAVAGSIQFTTSPQSLNNQDISSQVAGFIGLLQPFALGSLNLELAGTEFNDLNLAPNTPISHSDITGGSISSVTHQFAPLFNFVTTTSYGLDVSASSLSFIFGDSFSGGVATSAYAQASVTYFFEPGQEGPSPTPEPGTIALLGGALLAGGLIRRKRA